MNVQTRKRYLWGLTGLSLLVLAVWRIAISTGMMTHTPATEQLWWWFLLLWGALWTGFVFQPIVKASFPGPGHPAVAREPDRHLKDHETLMGYYPVVVLVVALSSFALSSVVYSGSGEGSLFAMRSPSVFFTAAITSGILNVGIFYYFTKALRYGDISLVSATQGLNPVLSIPLSFALFAIVGGAYVSNPSISTIGFVGIIVVAAAIAINGLTQKKKRSETLPNDDWFAHHPLVCALMSVGFASVAVNFDKIAVDAGNPFLAGIITMGTVAVLTLVWTMRRGGMRRVRFVFRTYAREFLVVGVVYGIVIIVMNTTLYGHNVNYYAAIKRSSAVFGTVYGLYVLQESAGFKNMLTRLLVSIAIVAGTFLIIFKG